MRYLLDTNVALDFMGNRLSDEAQKMLAHIIDAEINLSAINKIELLGFARVEQDIRDFVRCANIFPVDNAVVDKTIEVRRQHTIKLPDAIIAATALVNEFVLVSHNFKDFKNIQGLQLIDLYKIEI